MGLYKGHLFQGTYRMWQETRIFHLGKLDGTDEMFFSHTIPTFQMRNYKYISTNTDLCLDNSKLILNNT